jgi:TrmH family RNA methyltransferase
VTRVASFSTSGDIRTITSRQNPSVRVFRELTRTRKLDDDRVLLEGWHLLIEARQAGVPFERAVFTTDLLSKPEVARLAHELLDAGAEVMAVTGTVMEAVSPVRTPSGVVAIGRRESVTPDLVFARSPQLVLLSIDVQDPGNLGAMIRAAEAAGATGVIACGASADPFGWKALRGAMGSAFRLPIARAPIDQAMRAARAARVPVLAAVARVGHPLFETDLRGPTALLLGGEGAGVPLGLLEKADAMVSIPMRAPVESLNVAVAAALLMYEAARQRGGLCRKIQNPAVRNSSTEQVR